MNMCNKEQGYYQSEMTTPTREQVVQLRELFEKWFLENSQNHHAVPSGDDLLYQSSDGNYLLSSTAKLFKCFVFARADLEATIAEKDAEIERLKTVPMKYRRMQFNAQLQDENNELRQQLTEQQAHIEVLREALQEFLRNPAGDYTEEIAGEALATQTSADALREHDAKLIGEIERLKSREMELTTRNGTIPPRVS